LLRGDDLMVVRQQIFMGQAEQAKEYLSQQLAFFRIYPIRFARVQILFALALYQLKQHEQALRRYNKRLKPSCRLRQCG
jgi:tetratricopeptide (TPR) repeat protein